ncbi:MAG TPA: gamma-glutamyltransferase [Actinomycetes bacterium]
MEPRGSRPAAVAGGDPATVEAAATVLRAGGNAFDAAVAAGFASALAEPGLTSLGGGGFLLARTADGRATLVDFFVDTPGRGRSPASLEPHFTPVTVAFSGADQVFHVGYGSVGVPGALAGYLHVHERFGRLPLPDVVAPAQRLARQGTRLEPMQAAVVVLLADILTLTDEARAVFAPSGRLPATGDLVTNPRYADFLDEVAAGRVAGFADPALAQPLAAAMSRGGGLVGVDDLEGYRVVEREPLAFTYRGVRILTNPAPSFGGGLVAHGLERLEAGDPLATALAAISDRGLIARVRSVKGTTHVSVADTEGNVASMTTSNGSCSGVMVPGTGIQLNNVMGERDLHPDGFHAAPPGQRVGSMMAPTVVEHPDGRLTALGSGGSERIRSALTQVLRHLVDDGAAPQDAVDAPRLHWDGAGYQAEPGLPDEVLAGTAGAPVNVWPDVDVYFGGVHVVTTGRPGVQVTGDPRRGGATAIVPTAPG